MPSYRAYTGREKKFLKAAAKQLGLAVENRKLLQQLVHSRNEWASTFDSIPDYILVHDLEYRILRANSALLARLQRPRKEVVNSCAKRYCRGRPLTGRDVLIARTPTAAEKKTRVLAAIPWSRPRPIPAKTRPVPAQSM